MVFPWRWRRVLRLKQGWDWRGGGQQRRYIIDDNREDQFYGIKQTMANSRYSRWSSRLTASFPKRLCVCEPDSHISTSKRFGQPDIQYSESYAKTRLHVTRYVCRLLIVLDLHSCNVPIWCCSGVCLLCQAPALCPMDRVDSLHFKYTEPNNLGKPKRLLDILRFRDGLALKGNWKSTRLAIGEPRRSSLSPCY